MIISNLKIEHKENFEESVHKTFFAFLETYYKKNTGVKNIFSPQILTYQSI